MLAFEKLLGDFRHLLRENCKEVIRPACAEDRLLEYQAIFDWSAERNQRRNSARVRKRLERSGPARFNPRTGSKHFFDMLRRFPSDDCDGHDLYCRIRAARDVVAVQRMDRVLESRSMPLPPELTAPMDAAHLRYDRSPGAYAIMPTSWENTSNPQLIYAHPAPLIQLTFAYGRVLIELNIAACPTVVWHLIYTCSMNLHKAVEVCGCEEASRLQMSLTVSKQFAPVARETFSCEYHHKLQCNYEQWLLSVDLDVFADVAVSGKMLFALSLGEWPALHDRGDRVACGRVVAGAHVLEDLTLGYAAISRLPINVLRCRSFLREPEWL